MFGAFQTFGRMGAPAGRTLAQQIAAMSPSLWLEPSVTSGYQDSAGTTALTQPGAGSADPPVGLALDLSGLGNHAIQATSTARPKLSARVNLLTYTEDFSNALWIKYNASVTPGQADPLGGTSAATVTATGATARCYRVDAAATVTSGVTYTLSAYLRRKTGSGDIKLGCDAVPGYFSPALAVTSEWQRFSFTFTATATKADLRVPHIVVSGDAVDVWGAQLELGSTATAYQRVTDANTYDTAGFPLIHQFDGVDDVLNVTFPSSLGSDCTVVTANRGTTPTIATGQTIGTSYTITATNAGRLVFPRALTAAETAIVTKWATQKGALPS